MAWLPKGCVDVIRSWFVWGLLGLVVTQGHALAQRLPVADALTRPAVVVKDPARTGLLSVARAGARLVAVGERGVIVVSDDEGGQWKQVPAPTSVTLTAVAFADARHGVAVGHGGMVLATSDGGQTWAVRLDGLQVARLALEQAASAEQTREAERLVADGPDKPFLSVLMWDARRWLVAGAYGLVFETRDAGATWSSLMGRVPNEGLLHWYVLARQGNTLLMAGEQGLLARSTDGGATFSSVTSPYRGSWFAGDVAPDGRWTLGGLRGSAWRSDDEGASWTQLVNPVASSVVAMDRAGSGPGKGRLVLATQSGLLLAVDGGALQPVNDGRPVPMPAAIMHRGDGSLLSMGLSGVASTRSNQRTVKP